MIHVKQIIEALANLIESPKFDIAHPIEKDENDLLSIGLNIWSYEDMTEHELATTARAMGELTMELVRCFDIDLDSSEEEWLRDGMFALNNFRINAAFEGLEELETAMDIDLEMGVYPEYADCISCDRLKELEDYGYEY